MTRTEKRNKLKEWAKGIPADKMREIIVELTMYSIDSEYVCLYEDMSVPCYDATGETLDGTEIQEE